MALTDARLHPKLRRRTTHTGNARLGDIVEFFTVPQHTPNATAGYIITSDHLVVGHDVDTRLIPEARTQAHIDKPWSCILHTNAGQTEARSLWAWITRAGNDGESHFEVAMDGHVEQYMPLDVRADCNFSANRWVGKDGLSRGPISFETADKGSATVNATPWSLHQLDALIGIITALCVTYGIHCTQPGSWDASGIGHHSLFPYQGIGSKAWTNVKGKSCPGNARKAQMDHIRHEVQKRLILIHEATPDLYTCPGAK